MASHDMQDTGAELATERRAAERGTLPVSCIVILHGRPHSATGVDISEAGMGCLIDPPLGSGAIPLGLMVKVHLRLDSEALVLTAVIVRAELYSGGEVMLGLHVRYVSESDGDQIRTFVAAHRHALARAAG